MPPQLQALMENKRLLAIIIGAVALLIIVIIAIPKGDGGGDLGDRPLDASQKTLATVNGIGKAIEIQALLARQGIRLKQIGGDGDKVDLMFEDNAKQRDRDKALITLVQSGLMDKNVGLEAFEKGDLTASREEKRIKLIRAQQGELARLIRKIDPIEDASVAIAIPEQTLFRSEEKPISAAVQVTLPVGATLSRDKVRAITNLVVGSIQGLSAGQVAISDTHGTTYNSVLETGSDMETKLEEQDAYMRQKVASQLDRLVGPGRYVVTVSTEIRQAPRETLVQSFDPQGGVVTSKQAFNENLNAKGASGSGGPTSSFLPNSMGSSASGSSSNRDYLRSGVEVTYNNSKTQWLETRPAGMVEDISIAVTIDAKHFPKMDLRELQTLLARAASPKVNPANVSIARSNLPEITPLQADGAGVGGSLGGGSASGSGSGGSDMTWLYWAGGSVAVCLLLIAILSLTRGMGGGAGAGGPDPNLARTQEELAQLRDLATQQQAQLQATQQQTQLLLEAQQRQQYQSDHQALHDSTTPIAHQLPQNSELQQTLAELRDVVAQEDFEEDNLDLQIKSWIESS